jgi:hypothetical protein
MKSNKLRNFIKEVIPVGNMKEGVDFEIISFLVWDFSEDEICTIDQYYHLNSATLLKSIRGGGSPIHLISNEIESRTGIRPTNLCQTPFPEYPTPHFYKLKSPIEYHTAISMGFGIVRLLKSKKENDFLIYHAHSYMDGEDEDLVHNCIIEEIGLLKCYLLLTENGRFYDTDIVSFLEDYEDIFYMGLPAQPYDMVERIMMQLDKYKGELVVFPKCN